MAAPPAEFLSAANKHIYSQAIVEQAVDDLDGEARGPVEAVPLRVVGRARVHVECDVRPGRRGGRPWLRRRARRARVCNQERNKKKSRLERCVCLCTCRGGGSRACSAEKTTTMMR